MPLLNGPFWRFPPQSRETGRCAKMQQEKGPPPLDEPLKLEMVELISGFWFGFLGKEFL